MFAQISHVHTCSFFVYVRVFQTFIDSRFLHTTFIDFIHQTKRVTG